jgi:ATP-dependent Lon protease
LSRRRSWTKSDRPRGARPRDTLRSAPGVEAGARELAPEELRWSCDEAPLEGVVSRFAREAKTAGRADGGGRRATRIPVSVAELVGQPRALEAILTGLAQDGPGFNIFVCGPSGSGRETLVRSAVAEAVAKGLLAWLPVPQDRVYVADFDRPERPRLVTLRRGQGKRFKKELDELILVLRNAIGTAFEDDEQRRQRDRRKDRTDRAARRLFQDLSEAVRDEGFAIGPIPDGFAAPELRVEVKLGAPPVRRFLTRRKLEARMADGSLPDTRPARKRLARMIALQATLEDTAARARAISRRGAAALKRQDERTCRAAALGPVLDLAERYPTPAVKKYCDQLLEAIGDRLHVFLERHPDEPEPDPDRPPPENERPRPREGDAFAELRANLVVDASDRPVPPVIFEEVPTYPNLMGSLEAGDPLGPEHLRIRAGSLLAADGGVLVLDARELLADLAAWRALKKALARGKVDVQRFDPTSHQPSGPVRPRAVPIAIKVIVTGDEDAFRHLYEQDDDFRAIFKVKVEVEDDVPLTKESTAALALTVLRLAHRAELLPVDAGALARLLEHAARQSGRRDRLAVRIGELLDVIREAEAVARRAGETTVRAKHVTAALEARRSRHDLAERKTQELLDDGVVLVDTKGARTGQVNALAVYDTADHVFARPARVTAAISLGRAGVIDIEREAHLSGDTHHKGVQIMAGLLRSRYAQERPLCLTASVCFEQSYAPIDGDSASVAEVVAILSALADAPLDQGWAVTGSLNQKGDVQAIGDVNEKIEGFFDACRARGLTGHQGVLVPASNLGDLMLREDVVAAVAAGRFHVRATRVVDDVLVVLTGLEAREIQERVEAKLAALADAWRRYERQG